MLIEVPKYYMLLSRNCFQVFYNAFPNLVNLVSLNTESEESHVFQIFFSFYVTSLCFPFPSPQVLLIKTRKNKRLGCLSNGNADKDKVLKDH